MIKLCWAPLHSIENGKEKHTVQRPETDFQLSPPGALIDFYLTDQHTIRFIMVKLSESIQQAFKKPLYLI